MPSSSPTIFQFIHLPATHKTISSIHLQYYIPPAFSSFCLSDKWWMISHYCFNLHFPDYLLNTGIFSWFIGIYFSVNISSTFFVHFSTESLSIFLIDLYMEFVYVGYYFFVF